MARAFLFLRSSVCALLLVSTPGSYTRKAAGRHASIYSCRRKRSHHVSPCEEDPARKLPVSRLVSSSLITRAWKFLCLLLSFFWPFIQYCPTIPSPPPVDVGVVLTCATRSPFADGAPVFVQTPASELPSASPLYTWRALRLLGRENPANLVGCYDGDLVKVCREGILLVLGARRDGSRGGVCRF